MVNQKINLDYLLEIAKDDYYFLQKTLESMILQITQFTPQVKIYAATYNLLDLGGSLHKLKPCFKIIGANFLELTINDLEAAIAAGRSNQVIHELTDKLIVHLEVILPQLYLERDNYSNLNNSST
jgi:hypothetical protein